MWMSENANNSKKKCIPLSLFSLNVWFLPFLPFGSRPSCSSCTEHKHRCVEKSVPSRKSEQHTPAFQLAPHTQTRGS